MSLQELGQPTSRQLLVERLDHTDAARADVQEAFTNVRDPKRINIFWDQMTQTAGHVGRGIQILAEQLSSGEREKAAGIITAITKDNRLVANIRHVRKGDPDDAFTRCYAVVDGIANAIRQGAPIPEAAVNLIPQVIFQSGMNQEEQLYLFLSTADCFNFGNQNPLLALRDNRISGKPVKDAQRLVIASAKRLGKGEPNGVGLRLATAVYLSPRNWKIIHPESQTEIDFKTLAAFYLDGIANIPHDQYTTVINAITSAMEEGTSVTKEYLGRLLTGISSFQKPALDAQQIVKNQTFKPFLLQLLADVQTDPNNKTSMQPLANLIKASMIHLGEVFDNVLLSQLGRSDIPEDLQFLYTDAYLAFLSSVLGFSIDDWPTEDEQRGILNKTAVIYCEDFNSPNMPIILAHGTQFIDNNGRVVARPSQVDGRVIGYTKTRKTKVPVADHTPTIPKAFDFFETIPFIGKNNTAGSDSPHFVEIVTLFDNSPATQNGAFSPLHNHHDWHFFETIDPLFETQLQQALKKIGIKPNLPDHVIEAFDISLEEIGRDLPKENLARTRTLATRGNNVTLEENPIRSDENNFPRVYVKHDEPRRVNGVLSSDIFGTLYLTPNQQVDFFLDKNGYPQGDINKLYDEGLVSWPQIWQIKYRVTATIHKLLIASQEELSQKHDSLANRANKEIGSDRGTRGNSAGRLAEKVRESQRYFDVADFEWSMQPTDNEDQQKEGAFLSNELDKIDEAACQRAIEEMDKTGQKTKTLWRQLDATGMELARKEAHSKGYRVKKDPKNGYPMFMKSGRRQSIQAIDNAIENGVGLHKVIEITTNEAGLHDIVVSRSTFVSERTPAAIQENAA